jgi:hypothetical protein
MVPVPAPVPAMPAPAQAMPPMEAPPQMYYAPVGRAPGKRRRGGSVAERAVARSVSEGLLSFSAPDTMRQGRRERVEVGIARTTDLGTELEATFRRAGTRETQTVGTSDYMTVELVGDAFTIRALSPANQIVAPLARWEFDVTPVTAGSHLLTLVGTCWITVDGERRSLAVPSFDREIKVAVDVGYGLRHAVTGNWQWIVGTVMALGGAIAGWIALFH